MMAAAERGRAGSLKAQALTFRMTSGQSWSLLQNLLIQEEQLHLFSFIQELDNTDWKNISSCMNPTPKTLDLLQQDGTSARTLRFTPNDENNIVIDMVTKAANALGWNKVIRSISMAVLQYCPSGTNSRIGSSFPPHIDHCNDGSWVVLFSLGCTAIFHIKNPDMPEKKTFEMKSGDVLVFDPSSNAAILHGVDDVFEDEDMNAIIAAAGFREKFEVLCCSRYGVQCRVHFADC
jgi:hypothetical protein